MDAAPTPAPIRFIFHSGFCCSTLIADAMDCEASATVLKEPMIVNDLYGWRLRGAPTDQFSRVLSDACTLLARPFGAGESVIIKPSNVANALAADLLNLFPTAKAVLLYAPLHLFLNSIVRKGFDGRLWIRDLLGKLIMNPLAPYQVDHADLAALTDLQAAAFAWLRQQSQFAALIAQFDARRVCTLDCETFLADPERVLSKLCAFFDLRSGGFRVDALARHSKTRGAFDANARRTQQHAAEMQHGAELGAVTAWAHGFARAHAMPIALGGALHP